jgi:hypothetical protein
MRTVITVAIACGALLAAACGSARLVRRTQTGGVIALQGDRQKAMEDAQRMMADHCRGPYTIVEEGEHVVGTDTAGGSETYVDEYGNEYQEGGQSTREATEWRVHYECGAAQPPPQDYQEPPPPGTEY